MNNLKLASGVLLVFLVGALAGSLGTGFYYKKRVEKIEAGGPPVSERIQIVLGRFSNDLKLTKEQRDEFEKIVREAQEKILAIGRKSLPEIEEINEETFASIKERLTDEQKEKLEELIQRMEDVRDRFPSGQRQQQRTPDQSRPQQQGGPEQGHQQGSPEQIPPQSGPDQSPPQGQGTPGQTPPGVTPDNVIPRGGSPDAGVTQRDYMRIAGDMREQLNLSQEQEEKIRPLLEKFDRDQQDVFEEYKQEKQDSVVVKNALLEAEKTFEKELSDILTKDQMEKYRKEKESGAFKLSPPDMP